MNRRGFLGALLAAPVAVAAAIALPKRESTLSLAKYEWKSFHDGFALHEAELIPNSVVEHARGLQDELNRAFKACLNGGSQPDMILCSNDFYETYTGAMHSAKVRELKIQSLRRLARTGSPSAQRFAFKRLHQMRNDAWAA